MAAPQTPQFPAVQPVDNSPLATSVADAINRVRSEPNYLGNPHCFDDIVFKPGTVVEGDMLVHKDAVDNDLAGQQEFLLLGKVHVDHAFLHPDGTSVNKGNDQDPPHTRLRFAIRKPNHETCLAMADDYDTAHDNVIALADKMRKTAPSTKLPFTTDDDGILISHKFMMERTGEEEGSDEEVDNAVADAADGPEALFTVKGWPASPRWHDLAKPFERTHSIAPLPAYDEHGFLILPQQYRAKLIGATVVAKIAFVAFFIKGKKRVLSAQVERVHIIIPPPKRVSNAEKRTAQVMDGLKKKRRLQL